MCPGPLRERRRVQPVVDRLARTVVQHLVRPLLVRIAAEGAVQARGQRQRHAGGGAEDSRQPPARGQRPRRGVVELRRLHRRRRVEDVPAVVVARTVVSVEPRIPVAGRIDDRDRDHVTTCRVRRPASLRSMAFALRQRVVRASAEPVHRAALHREQQPVVFLRAVIGEVVEEPDEAADLRIELRNLPTRIERRRRALAPSATFTCSGARPVGTPAGRPGLPITRPTGWSCICRCSWPTPPYRCPWTLESHVSGVHACFEVGRRHDELPLARTPRSVETRGMVATPYCDGSSNAPIFGRVSESPSPGGAFAVLIKTALTNSPFIPYRRAPTSASSSDPTRCRLV